MKQTLFITGILMALMLVSLPAFAGSRDYIEDMLDDWVEFTEDEGYEVIYTDIDMIDVDHTIVYTFELEPGMYMFMAEGGKDVEDIDMYVYDEDGNELASDILDDNYPFCELEVKSYITVDVEVIAYSFFGGVRKDYLCFVAGGISWDDFDDLTPETSSDPGEIIDYWIDWAEDSGYMVLFTDTGALSDGVSDFLGFELDRGMYHMYTESIFEMDDIDLTVRDENGDILNSDTMADNYPICSFELSKAGIIEAEIIPVSYEMGSATEYAIVLATQGDGAILTPGFTDTPYEDQIVSDESDHEYISGILDEYMTLVIEGDYEMIYDEIGILSMYESGTMTIDLGRGDYVLFAEAGLRIADLDLRVFNEDGYIVAADMLVNYAPMCEFTTKEAATFEVELTAHEMEPGWSEGYYMLVIVRK